MAIIDDPVSAVVNLFNGVGSKIIERVWPDPAQAQAAKIELAKMAESGELARMANETEEVKNFLADQASARDRDKAFLVAGRKNMRGDVLAYLAMGALLATILLLLFGPNIPPASEKLLYVVLGALITIVKDVYGFEFGSSKDSQRNAQAVTDMLKQE
jgi:hypothetical protein